MPSASCACCSASMTRSRPRSGRLSSATCSRRLPRPALLRLGARGASRGAGEEHHDQGAADPGRPHKTDIQPEPRTEDDLFVNADGQWLTAYDNLSTLDQHWSDAFCRISTGSGYSKRKLLLGPGHGHLPGRAAADHHVHRRRGGRAGPARSLAPGADAGAETSPPRRSCSPAWLSCARILGQLLDAAAVALRDQRE